MGADVLPFSSRPKEHVHDGGYVRSYRRVYDGDSVLGSDRRLIGAWMEMIAVAAWKPVDLQFGESWIKLSRGQLVINHRDWAKRWFLPLATFYRACKRMEKEGRIRLEVKRVRNGLETACTVLTIVNYDTYQAQTEHGETGSEQGRNIDSKKERKVCSESHTDSELPLDISEHDPSIVPSDGPKEHRVRPGRQVYPADFETFWRTYPKRGTDTKVAAFKAWQKALKTVTPALLIEAVSRYCDYVQSNGHEAMLVQTWVNRDGWTMSYRDHKHRPMLDPVFTL